MICCSGFFLVLLTLCPHFNPFNLESAIRDFRLCVCVCARSLDCFYFGKVGLWAPSPFLLLEQQLWQVTSCCLLQIVSLLKTHLAAETSRMRNESAGQETISPQTDSLCFGAVAGAGGGWRRRRRRWYFRLLMCVDAGGFAADSICSFKDSASLQASSLLYN